MAVIKSRNVQLIKDIVIPSGVLKKVVKPDKENLKQ